MCGEGGAISLPKCVDGKQGLDDNGVDPEEMAHHEPPHQDLRCL